MSKVAIFFVVFFLINRKQWSTYENYVYYYYWSEILKQSSKQQLIYFYSEDILKLSISESAVNKNFSIHSMKSEKKTLKIYNVKVTFIEHAYITHSD